MTAIAKLQNTEISTYDPERGLKEISVAEAAEKFYTRAKDPEHLYEAIALKLQAQREFVVWWDGLGDKRGRPEKTSRTNDVFPKVEDLGLDRDTVHRWRKKLKDDAAFSKALEAAQERCRRVCEAEKGATDQKGASGTGENAVLCRHSVLPSSNRAIDTRNDVDSFQIMMHDRDARKFVVTEVFERERWPTFVQKWYEDAASTKSALLRAKSTSFIAEVVW